MSERCRKRGGGAERNFLSEKAQGIQKLMALKHRFVRIIFFEF